jgi:hypothetical protein
MVADTTIEIHDMLVAGHLHQARDSVCRLLAQIEQGMRRGEATDQCYQSKQGDKCVHVFLTQDDVDARLKQEEVWE